MCLRDKLPLRAGLALSSKLVGHLTANQMVEVMQKESLDNGLVRARVGKLSSPRGLVIDPLGWATLRTDQDEDLMRLVSNDEVQDMEWRREADERRERIERDKCNFREGSMASRIAQRRRENLVGRKNFQQGLSVTQQVDLIMPKIVAELRSVRGGRAAVERQAVAAAVARVPNPYDLEFPEEHEAWMNPAVLQRLSDEHYQVRGRRMFEQPKRRPPPFHHLCSGASTLSLHPPSDHPLRARTLYARALYARALYVCRSPPVRWRRVSSNLSPSASACSCSCLP